MVNPVNSSSSSSSSSSAELGEEQAMNQSRPKGESCARVTRIVTRSLIGLGVTVASIGLGRAFASIEGEGDTLTFTLLYAHGFGAAAFLVEVGTMIAQGKC